MVSVLNLAYRKIRAEDHIVMLSRREMMTAAAASFALPVAGCSRGDEEYDNVIDSKTTTNNNLEQVLVPPKELPFNVGRGIDGSFGGVLAQIATGNIHDSNVTDESNYNPSKLKYTLVEDQNTYNRTLSKSASAKGSYGAYSASGSISSTTTEANNSYSLHVMAIARRSNQQRMLDPSSVRIDPQVLAGITKRANDPAGRAELLRIYGDRYIMGFSSGSDLLIDIAFQTSSAEKKRQLSAEISGAVAGLASGKAGYQDLMSSAKSQKSISANIIGLDGTGVPKTFDANEVYDNLVKFFNDQNRPSVITRYDIRRMSDLIINGDRLDYVSEVDFARRQSFVAAVRAALEILDNSSMDASYVQSNGDEFAKETFERAVKDQAAVKIARQKIERRAALAYGDFRDTGKTNENLFDEDYINVMVPSGLSSYPQAPLPGVNAPQPQPRSEPNIKATDILQPHKLIKKIKIKW